MKRAIILLLASVTFTGLAFAGSDSKGKTSYTCYCAYRNLQGACQQWVCY